MKKTYVIGDIHGCHLTLDSLLEKIAPVPGKDTVIVLGDMINRGPGSSKVLDRLIKLRLEGYEIIAIKGNHEFMFLNYLAGKNQNFFLINGGEKTIKSYCINNPFSKDSLHKIPKEHIQFLENLLPYWEDETYIYVHAGIEPGIRLSEQSTDWLYWARDNFIAEQYDYEKRVIFGHTPFSQPLIQKNKIGIDTGAVYGGKLTCLILPDFEFASVDGLKTEDYGKQE